MMILVVDDNAMNLSLIRETLKEQYKVNVVTSGEQAIRFLTKKSVDLVLLDVFMPVMGGLETLRRISEIPGFNSKVAVLSATLDYETKTDFKKLGVTTFIQKPFLQEDLMAAVSSLLS